MRNARTWAVATLVLGFLAGGTWWSGATEPTSPGEARHKAQQALGPLQTLVGQWRGVGQPERGSNRGAWVERQAWRWDYAGGGARLVAQVTDGKLYSAARLAAGTDPETLDLTLVRADGSADDRFEGRAADEGFVFAAAESRSGGADRVTLRVVAGGDRLVLLLERRAGSGERFVRLAEVGLTRDGSRFGQGATQPECVVTGGAGTIPVEYEGRTYYVCCTGCKQLFDDDPAGVLADYRAQRGAAESSVPSK